MKQWSIPVTVTAPSHMSLEEVWAEIQARQSGGVLSLSAAGRFAISRGSGGYDDGGEMTAARKRELLSLSPLGAETLRAGGK